MIKQRKNITKVKFGKDGQGTLVVGVYGNQSTTLIIQQVLGDHKIGGEITSKHDIKPLPKIAMEFFEEESVEAMIKVLERIKKNIIDQKYPYGQFYLAC